MEPKLNLVATEFGAPLFFILKHALHVLRLVCLQNAPALCNPSMRNVSDVLELVVPTFQGWSAAALNIKGRFFGWIPKALATKLSSTQLCGHRCAVALLGLLSPFGHTRSVFPARSG